jgi:hypothetical protein
VVECVETKAQLREDVNPMSNGELLAGGEDPCEHSIRVTWASDRVEEIHMDRNKEDFIMSLVDGDVH